MTIEFEQTAFQKPIGAGPGRISPPPSHKFRSRSKGYAKLCPPALLHVLASNFKADECLTESRDHVLSVRPVSLPSLPQNRLGKRHPPIADAEAGLKESKTRSHCVKGFGPQKPTRFALRQCTASFRRSANESGTRHPGKSAGLGKELARLQGCQSRIQSFLDKENRTDTDAANRQEPRARVLRQGVERRFWKLPLIQNQPSDDPDLCFRDDRVGVA